MAHQTQQTMDQYSTDTISQTLLTEITNALKNVSPYGSVEIYVQDSVVTQITVRNIKKTTQTVKAKTHHSERQRVAAGI